tara:strand:+ start:186 stop:689 length:504 start_codon:yes stop_codon:yes gene_type:complete
MTEYSIYSIVCKDPLVLDCYVGQTMNFMNRKRNHKDNCINPKRERHNIKLYTFIRDNGNWDNWNMVLIKIYNCVDKFEAIQYERLHYEELNASLNDKYPGRTKKESYAFYCANNPEKEKTRHTLYKSNNQDKIKEQKQCDCGKTYQHDSYARHCRSQYHLKNITNVT